MDIQLIVQRLNALKPGERLIVSRLALADMRGKVESVFPLLDFNPVDRIMESVIGSSYDMECVTDPQSGDCHFTRLKEPVPDGYRTWVSADRRHLYKSEWNRWKYIGPIGPMSLRDAVAVARGSSAPPVQRTGY